MTGSAVPGWDAAVEAGARVQQQRVNPMCPWDESDCQDLYRADAVAVLAAALPLVLAALEAEIRAKVTYSDEEDDALDFVCRFVATYRKEASNEHPSTG